MLFVQGGIVGAHQDKPDLACSASKSNLVTSCTGFHDVVHISEALNTTGSHVGVTGEENDLDGVERRGSESRVQTRKP